MIHSVWEAEEVNPTQHLQPPEWGPPGNSTTLALQTGGSSALSGNGIGGFPFQLGVPSTANL